MASSSSSSSTTTVGETLNMLMEMGFSENKSKRALMETGWRGVEPATEWLLAHIDDPEPDEEEMAVVDEAPKRVLTEEEKAEQLKKLEVLRIKKRAEREEKEKVEAVEREKRRVRDGKKMTELKKTMEEKEMAKIVEERKREKRETDLARERVKAQIEADKRARREARGEIVPKPAAPPAPPVSSSPSPKKDYIETKLQIRLIDGSTIVQTFKVKEPLSAVRLFVELNRKDGGSGRVKLMTNFPKKVFSDDDYDTPLEALGLVPSAVLIVVKDLGRPSYGEFS